MADTTDTDYADDYPRESIGGGNQYKRCSSCKLSAPQINGYLSRHHTWCEYRKAKEAAAAQVPSASSGRLDRVALEEIAVALGLPENAPFEVMLTVIHKLRQPSRESLVRAVEQYTAGDIMLPELCDAAGLAPPEEGPRMKQIRALQEKVAYLERERDEAFAERDKAREKAATAGKLGSGLKQEVDSLQRRLQALNFCEKCLATLNRTGTK